MCMNRTFTTHFLEIGPLRSTCCVMTIALLKLIKIFDAITDFVSMNHHKILFSI